MTIDLIRIGHVAVIILALIVIAIAWRTAYDWHFLLIAFNVVLIVVNLFMLWRSRHI